MAPGQDVKPDLLLFTGNSVFQSLDIDHKLEAVKTVVIITHGQGWAISSSEGSSSPSFLWRLRRWGTSSMSLAKWAK
jgi:hypothetical protein